jgi:streptomycin 6-kinase
VTAADPGALLVPPALRSAARENPELRAWVSRLPGVVAAVAERWSVRAAAPFAPGGRSSWVAPATTADGDDRVLKVGWRHAEAEHEAEGLRAWSGRGSVLLYRHHVHDHETSALLLERCRPGRPLARTVREPDQDLVVAGLLRQMWAQPLDWRQFRSLGAMCDDWATEFEARRHRAKDSIDPGVARAAMALLRELPATARDTVLLCTDLHAGNVLSAQRQPWLVIDPKPHLGDPTYDAVQHMLNCAERLQAGPARFVHRMAALLDVDGERLRYWVFARCVQDCLDHPQLYRAAVELAP